MIDVTGSGLRPSTVRTVKTARGLYVGADRLAGGVSAAWSVAELPGLSTTAPKTSVSPPLSVATRASVETLPAQTKVGTSAPATVGK